MNQRRMNKGRMNQPHAKTAKNTATKSAPALAKMVALTALLLTCPMPGFSQGAAPGPWFGLDLPPDLEPHVSPAIIGSRGPAPAVVPPEESDFPELDGERISRDLRQIVDISIQSRLSQELGGTLLWGRVSGFPSGDATVDWAAEQFRQAGIGEVRVQQFEQDADAEQWLPLDYEVTLLGSDQFGPGSRDVTLTTAVALAPSEIAGGSLTAPVVYVGTGSPAELIHVDVRGKIAIQRITPQAHLVFERSRFVPQANDIMSRGAVAVINLIDQPGNEMARDMSNCGGPCFNVGGRDSHFLTAVMNAAAVAGNLDQLRMRLSVNSAVHRGLIGRNAVAVIPGQSAETIVLNAHVDAWYDGAGDNGDGLAVLVALARHFNRPEIQLRRTLVLVASAGHHTRGLNGPRAAVSLNPDLFGNSVLIFNLEHVAQRNFSPARSEFEDGYREYIADSGEAPIVAGITNSSPYLQSLFDQGVQRYGTNFVSGDSTMASGEGGGYRTAGVPIVTTMQAPPLYHTSGEVFEVVSTPGLERMARFMSWFVKQVDGASRSQIDP
ncbi:MAG: M28 family peptidase [Gammaproteobacteria bacterium]|nr:M28 family peptidase [Pseudomonadales bacterium]MCP5346900.1 M28 family peptidase [Pseudomonadales bacterium]